MDGLELYFAADGEYLGKYGKSTEMRVIHDTEVKQNVSAALSSPGSVHSGYFEHYLPAFTDQVFHATRENEISIISKWGRKNRNTEREHAMSIYTKYIEDPNGNGYFPVFWQSETISGEADEFGKPATVDPSEIQGLLGWEIHATAHTHTKGDWNDFSNEDEQHTGVGGLDDLGGDIPWSVSTRTPLYLIPPIGNNMGYFDPVLYDALVEARLVLDNKDYQEDMERLYGGPYILNRPQVADFDAARDNLHPRQSYWIKPNDKYMRADVRALYEKIKMPE